MAVESDMYNLQPIAVGAKVPDIALAEMATAGLHPLTDYYADRWAPRSGKGEVAACSD